MSLEEWRRNSWLTAAKPQKSEIAQLLEVADRELADGQVMGVSVDGRFMHLYDAALALCNVALRACGYRVAKGQGSHKKAIESLRFTLGKDRADFAKVADQIEVASRLRGMALYDRSGVVSETNVADLLALVRTLRSDLAMWLNLIYPTLTPESLQEKRPGS